MDDMMLELTAGNQQLRRRLDAFAEARLSPDAQATARMRSRVMAAAHRQAAGLAAGHGLAVITPDATVDVRRVPGTRRRGRVAALLAAAGLVAALGIGTVSAGQAGGPLYDLRLHAETLLLPADPPQRAVAEVARLQTRLAEAAAARLRGDMPAMRAALSAYAEIVDHAATAAILAGDPIGSAALEAGVARNVVVLRALLEDSPDAAASGLSRALERSDAAIDGIPGGDGNGGGAPASPERPDRTERPSDTPTPRQTAEPTPDLTPEPATSPTPERSPKPTKTPTATPTETPEPMPTPTATPALTPMPTPVSEPEPSQRPGRTPPGRPSDVPGQQGKESSPGA